MEHHTHEPDFHSNFARLFNRSKIENPVLFTAIKHNQLLAERMYVMREDSITLTRVIVETLILMQQAFPNVEKLDLLQYIFEDLSLHASLLYEIYQPKNNNIRLFALYRDYHIRDFTYIHLFCSAKSLRSLKGVGRLTILKITDAMKERSLDFAKKTDIDHRMAFMRFSNNPKVDRIIRGRFFQKHIPSLLILQMFTEEEVRELVRYIISAQRWRLDLAPNKYDYTSITPDVIEVAPLPETNFVTDLLILIEKLWNGENIFRQQKPKRKIKRGQKVFDKEAFDRDFDENVQEAVTEVMININQAMAELEIYFQELREG